MKNAEKFLDDTAQMIYKISEAVGYDPNTILNMPKVKRIITDLGQSFNVLFWCALLNFIESVLIFSLLF